MADLVVLPDADRLADDAADRFLRRLVELQADGHAPHIALTGGTIATSAYLRIAAQAADHDVDWTRVAFWWGDERFVPAGTADRNDTGAREAFLDRLGATDLHPMPATDGCPDVVSAADRYADELRSTAGGAFDLVLLGMGPDGHVASLFPGHAALGETDAIAVGVTDSPKPPPERVTLTFEALNRSREVWFWVSGTSKAAAVRRALADHGTVSETPARGIDPHPPDPARPGKVVWHLDAAAASAL